MIEREKPLAGRMLELMAKTALAISAGLLCGHIMVALIKNIG